MAPEVPHCSSQDLRGGLVLRGCGPRRLGPGVPESQRRGSALILGGGARRVGSPCLLTPWNSDFTSGSYCHQAG